MTGNPAHLAEHPPPPLPALAERLVMPGGRDLGKQLDMHAAVRRVAMPGEPRLLGSKANHRSQPADEAVEAAIEHRAHRPPPDIIRRIAIEPIFADIEI